MAHEQNVFECQSQFLSLIPFSPATIGEGMRSYKMMPAIANPEASISRLIVLA
jgi:hypothetical protein